MGDKRSFSEWLDFVLNKVLPKKLIAVILATIFVFTGQLDGDMWAYIIIIYIGVNQLQHLGFNLTDLFKSRKKD